MRVVIPTRNRVHKQKTLRFLSPALRANCDLVCPSKEVHQHEFYRDSNPKDHRVGVTIVAQPDDGMSIAQKRAWIMSEWAERGHEKIIMLDDDLEWWIRIQEGDWHLRHPTAEDMDDWFGQLAARLTPETPHAGFGPRQGNNTKGDKHGHMFDEKWVWQIPDRMMYTLGYYLPTVLDEVELGRIEHREDMDYCLQLLRKGYPNAVCHWLNAGQGSYGAPGGTTGERTVEGSNADAERLAELHPGYVRVVEKAYTSSIPRKEVTIQWKKALEFGKQWRASQSGSGEERRAGVR